MSDGSDGSDVPDVPDVSEVSDVPDGSVGSEVSGPNAPPSPSAPPGTERRTLTGWGGTAPSVADVARPTDPGAVAALIAGAPRRGVIGRGLGRSYNDAAQNAGGLVIESTGLDAVRAFDIDRGVITVDAGVSLDDLMRMIIPFGWFVPVTPGTRYVTVGGALAADIHGKNHHVDGSFANHVHSFVLQTPKGTVKVTPDNDAELFWTTAGAMGLTGIVTEVTLELIAVESSLMSVDTERGRDLDDVMARMVEGDHRYRYTVAWIDCVATGAALGRGVLTRGDHAPRAQLPAKLRSRALHYDADVKLQAPPWVPNGLLNKLSIRAFNELWFRKAPKEQRDHLESIPTFFHPLDFVGGWNRMYGARGFVQYQYVVPDTESDAVRRSLELLSGSRAASFLTVLKRFGPGNPGPLSFPSLGWTLALDIPAATSDLAPLLDLLDDLVLDAGGRVYLAKDARVGPDRLRRMYPDLDRLGEVRGRVDPSRVLQSDLARRLDLP